MSTFGCLNLKIYFFFQKIKSISYAIVSHYICIVSKRQVQDIFDEYLIFSNSKDQEMLKMLILQCFFFHHSKMFKKKYFPKYFVFHFENNFTMTLV